jgi:hypothetical protein
MFAEFEWICAEVSVAGSCRLNGLVSAYGRQHAGGQLSTPKLPNAGVQVPVIVQV